MMKKQDLTNFIIQILTDHTDSFELEPWLTANTLYLVSAVNLDTKIDLSESDDPNNLKYFKWLERVNLLDSVKSYVIPPQKHLYELTPYELIHHADDTHEKDNRTVSDIEHHLSAHLVTALQYLKICQYRIKQLSDNDWIDGELVYDSKQAIDHDTLSKFLDWSE